MWLEKFIKKIFISFYFEDKYKVLIEEVKNKQIINSTKKEFENKKELQKEINSYITEHPQTYISSILLTLNQGVIDSCSKQKYLEKDIDYEEVKTICINNSYSFYASIYDINHILKNFSFPIDFLYSIFAVIDFTAKERKNRFYVLILKNYLAILGFENFKPIYSEIIEIEEKKEEIEEIDDLDIIDEIEDIEEISEDIEKADLDELNEKELNKKLDNITTDIEIKVINHIKDSLKDYYENYSNDFIEKIILLDTIGVDINITNLIEEEIFISAELEQFDILKTINRMSIESL